MVGRAGVLLVGLIAVIAMMVPIVVLERMRTDQESDRKPQDKGPA
jgi:hypothetical protein